MSLAAAIEARGNTINSFELFCEKVSEYIDVQGQDLHHARFNDTEFEAVAQLNEAFGWPSADNWVDWREGLRQIFWYAQLNDIQRQMLQDNNLEWLLGRPFYLHISNDDPTQVAYLPERDDVRNEDRMQRGRIGRFFSRHLNINDENFSRRLTETFNTSNWNYVLTRDRNMIRRIYRYGPRSCMSGNIRDPHPAEAYGSGDFAMLASYAAGGSLGDQALSFNGRALISLANNFTIRRYGNDGGMEVALAALGTEHGHPNASWDRLIKETEGGSYIFPYLDFTGSYRIIADPLSPQRGAGAMWRNIPVPQNNVREIVPNQVMSINSHSQAGRTRGRRLHNNAMDEWPEPVLESMRNHDALVEPAWESLLERFELFTRAAPSEDAPRIIPVNIPWTARPEVQRRTCIICGEEITLNHDSSNVTLICAEQPEAETHTLCHADGCGSNYERINRLLIPTIDLEIVSGAIDEGFRFEVLNDGNEFNWFTRNFVLDNFESFYCFPTSGRLTYNSTIADENPLLQRYYGESLYNHFCQLEDIADGLDEQEIQQLFETFENLTPSLLVKKVLNSVRGINHRSAHYHMDHGGVLTNDDVAIDNILCDPFRHFSVSDHEVSLAGEYLSFCNNQNDRYFTNNIGHLMRLYYIDKFCRDEEWWSWSHFLARIRHVYEELNPQEEQERLAA